METQRTPKNTPNAVRGRPRKIPQIEQRLGVLVEHHVLEQMARGKGMRDICAALGVSRDTIRRHLRRRGYRIECETRCVAIGRPPRPGRSVAAR